MLSLPLFGTDPDAYDGLRFQGASPASSPTETAMGDLHTSAPGPVLDQLNQDGVKELRMCKSQYHPREETETEGLQTPEAEGHVTAVCEEAEARKKIAKLMRKSELLPPQLLQSPVLPAHLLQAQLLHLQLLLAFLRPDHLLPPNLL
ncbi:hypothetical protein H920_19829 [Fukomys damarensis]|uniref:Uncharacterized protein n=1 Tax=Fukomys damarensis TaxID=885580 RepID=A0A091CNT5_FUKDA|nr:hypothetical protein H920_19829 [Fukomys damarensis]